MTDKIPYQLLDVDSEDDELTIRLAYRDKIFLYNKKSIAKKEFILINRAYETLSDYDKRKHYNNTKQWTKDLMPKDYTLQQLAVEDLQLLKIKLQDATIREVNAQDPITGHTPLYCAARIGHLEACKFLVENGAEPDLCQRTKSTALHAASFFGHPNVVKYLLQSGASYNVKNNFNNIPKNETDSQQIVNLFTELEEDPFVQAFAGNLDYFKNDYVKLERHIDEQNHLRQTLLNCASKKGYLELEQWLVDNDANLDIVDKHLNSPLHVAASNGHRKVVEYLLNKGANPNLYNKWAATAEDEATNHPDIIQLFKEMKEKNSFEMAGRGKHDMVSILFSEKVY
ncbi:unnamed protein product [Didymodactylos carnosus]|uniref:J domain-containing protein n=1 Tax=Didymodactylos carnosus TaxID=1234261 RepID=A0A8S2JM57_9BILA|nr:unnamed protein product [Didymodactylos carnosus]CAF3817330.1 unnamed protein product [Didymodactylos carnosus]